MRNLRYLIVLSLVLFLVACVPQTPSEDYGEFDFDELDDTSDLMDDISVLEAEIGSFERLEQESLPDPSDSASLLPIKELEQLIPEADPNKGETTVSETDLVGCFVDADCELVQPDFCCACPTAINVDYVGDVSSIKLGEKPTCAGPSLCGACANHKTLEAQCVHDKCVAVLEGTEVEEVVVLISKDEVISYEDPALVSGNNFLTLNLKPACQGNDNSIYIQYSMSSPAVTELQMREEGKTEYSTIFINDENLYTPEIQVVLCDGCRKSKYAYLHYDKTYYLRLRSITNKEITYAGDYKVDTSKYSEYRQKKC